MAPENNEKLITVREAAKECGRNMETVRRWIWSGKLPAEKLGNQLFIKKGDLASYCRETAVKYEAQDKTEITARLERLKERVRARTVGDFPEEVGGAIRGQPGERLYEIEHDLVKGETSMKESDRANLIKRMRKLREEIRARTGKVFDAEAIIRELRDERDRELR